MTQRETTPCTVCGFELWNPIANLNVSVLSLYDDARFPGRCILELEPHHEAVEEVELTLFNQYWSDIRLAIQAIKQTTGVERVNVAFLGNTVPHVHAHLIPRYPEQEQYPGKSPWNDPRATTPLPADKKNHLITTLRNTIQSSLNI